MKRDPVTAADIAASVWAVPPLALDEGGGIEDAANRALVDHMQAGGIRTILWGGNANVYGMGAARFADLIDRIEGWVGADVWAVPSVGPDAGRLQDQAAVLRGRGFPAAMLLPYAGPRDAGGTEAALRGFVQAAGVPGILYLRQADYLPPARIAALVDAGEVVAVKYAVETGDLTQDPYLDAVLAEVPRDRVVSGIGEIAALSHVPTFRLAGFTAGAVCIAPRRAMAVLAALQAGDAAEAQALTRAIEPLEALREAHGPIPVIHEAVTASGIAAMGRIGPHFSTVGEAVRARIAEAVAPLVEGEAKLAAAA